MKRLTEAQKRKAINDKWIDRLFLFVFTLFFGFAFWFAYNSYFRYDIYKERILVKLENKEVEPQQICMFRNQLIIGATSSIVIDGETFYVCCPGCADNLKNNYMDSQFAFDGYSHHKIKKTKAIIVLKNKNNLKVGYFETENNFNQFNQNRN